MTTTAAFEVPEPTSSAVNKVFPQFSVVTVAVVAANMNSGSMAVKVSQDEISKFAVKPKVTEEAVFCVFSAIVKLVVPSDIVPAVAVEVVIGRGGTSVAADMIAEIVRVSRFAGWGFAATLVVAEFVMMVHCTSACKATVATLNVAAALALPEAAVLRVQVVVPQPVVVGAAVPARVQPGRVTTILSSMASTVVSLKAM